MNLVSLDISDNAGLEGTASFLSKVISNAPKLVSIDARNNWIHIESLPTICSFLEAIKGKLEHLNLRYNHLCENPDIASLLAKYQINGKPNILLSKPIATLFDNDP